MRDELGQRQHAQLLGALAVDEGRPVTAGLASLQHERVGSGGLRDARLREVGHRHPDLGAAARERGDHLRARAAEGERDDGHPFVGEHLQLRIPSVVVEPRLGRLDVLRLAQPLDVRAHRLLVDVGAAGHEEVDAVGSRRPLPQGVDVRSQHVGAEVAGGEEAEPAGLADRGRERGRRRAARERREHDRIPKLVNDHLFAESIFHVHLLGGR